VPLDHQLELNPRDAPHLQHQAQSAPETRRKSKDAENPGLLRATYEGKKGIRRADASPQRIGNVGLSGARGDPRARDSRLGQGGGFPETSEETRRQKTDESARKLPQNAAQGQFPESEKAGGCSSREMESSKRRENAGTTQLRKEHQPLA